MRKYLEIALILFLAIVFIIAYSSADDITFEVIINRASIPLGESAQLSLNFYGSQNVPAPNLPEIEGFNWRYIGPSTRMSIVNGKISISVTHMYNLAAVKVGTFKIPAMSVDYGGKTYTSQPVTVEVTKTTVSQSPSPVDTETTSQSDIQGLSDRIFLATQVGKKKAYVNEIIPVNIKLFINRLAVRDIQYPEFAHEGFLVEEFGQPKQYKTVLNGILYDVIEFDTNIFGTHPGELTMGPAQLKCSLVFKRSSGRQSSSPFGGDEDIFSDFFDRYDKRSVALESTAFPLEIAALPEEGKPADFNGALGNYTFNFDISPKEVKIGDPITLTMTVQGDGNLKTVSAPKLNFNENDFKIYEPQVTQDANSKKFEQVIIPKNENIKDIPQISFSFFDTKTGEYKSITTGPTPIKVNPLPKGEELKVFELPEASPGVVKKQETLGRDIIFIKEDPGNLKKKDGFLYRNKLFIASLFMPLIAIFSVLVISARREKLKADISYARRLRAPGGARRNLARTQKLLSGEPDKFFEAVFKTLQEYLGDRFHLPIAGITSSIVEDPKLANIDKDIRNDISSCFNICDRARYAPSSITKDEMPDTFKLIRETIDKLERIRV